jgi:hypothetical protein
MLGYGFVKFGIESDQLRALGEMTGQFCGSRPIRVSVAMTKNKLGTATPTGTGMATAMNPNMGMGFPMGVSPNMSSYYNVPLHQMPIPPQMQQQIIPPAYDPQTYGQPIIEPEPNTTVFVGGLTPSIGDHELRA